MTIVQWGARAAARVAEIAAQRAEVAALQLPVPGAPPTSVGSLLAAFRAAGATAASLPRANASALGGLGEAYDLAAWDGGPFEFVSCDLPRRGPEFVGACEAKTVSCAPSSVDRVPYACVRLADNTSVAGSLANSTYRQGCELPCDLELDCAALCSCGESGCGSGEVCTCAACRALQSDAAADGEFMTIAAAASSAGAAAALFAPMGGAGGARRRLAQASNEEVIAQLAAVSGKVDSLRAAQDAVASQVASLQARVDQANLLAEARAANTRVPDLITGALPAGMGVGAAEGLG